jgi:signal transduction histidine kinase
MKRKHQREYVHDDIAGLNHKETGSKVSEAGGVKDSKKPSIETQITRLLEETKVLREEIAVRRTAEKVLLKAGKEKEEQIRSMIFHHTISEERSRRRFSSFLHDNICQSLGIVKIKLGSLVKSISSANPEALALLEEVTQIIQSTITDVRSVISDLSPAVLHEFGFEAALEWLSRQFHEQNGIPCAFENDRLPKPIKEETGILLFCSVRDLLINVADHAQAGSVRIRALQKHDKLHIVVEDDGVGFIPLDNGLPLRKNGKLGLFGIQKRMSSIGGSMEIVSAKSKGTRVTLVSPL